MCIGKEALRKYVKLIWDCRKNGLLYYNHISNYKGYKNTDCKEQKWITDCCNYIINHIAISKEHYVSKKTGLVYMELKDGEE